MVPASHPQPEKVFLILFISQITTQEDGYDRTKKAITFHIHSAL